MARLRHYEFNLVLATTSFKEILCSMLCSKLWMKTNNLNLSIHITCTQAHKSVIQYLLFLMDFWLLSSAYLASLKKKKNTWECHTKGMWYLFNCCLATLKCSGQEVVCAVSHCNSSRNTTVPKI